MKERQDAQEAKAKFNGENIIFWGRFFFFFTEVETEAKVKCLGIAANCSAALR